MGRKRGIMAAMLMLAGCGIVTDDAPIEGGSIDTGEQLLDTASADTAPADPLSLTPQEFAARSAQANLLMLSDYVSFLESVKAETGTYPETRSMRSAYNAMKDLAEAASITLPETPETSEEETRARFAYRSDGTDYKLIAERSGDCFVVREIEPQRVDPKRASGPVDCYGYGFWTDGAETW
ncbi:MAG: hypothetical protein V3V03_02580 [Hyphomonadaceae bacterium]